MLCYWLALWPLDSQCQPATSLTRRPHVTADTEVRVSVALEISAIWGGLWCRVIWFVGLRSRYYGLEIDIGAWLNRRKYVSRRIPSEDEDILSKTGPNSLIITDEAYDKIAAVLGRASTTPSSEFRPEEKLTIRRYKMAVVNGSSLIFRANNNKEIVKASSMFDVLHEWHQTLCHGGRDKMQKELNAKYHNIARPAIQAYLSGCVPTMRDEEKTPKCVAGHQSNPVKDTAQSVGTSTSEWFTFYT